MNTFLQTELTQLRQDTALTARDRHTVAIFADILLFGSTTRGQLVNRLDLRSGTVSSILRDLLDNGVVKETESQRFPVRGRPTSVIAPNLNRFVALSFYIEGLRLRGGVLNLGEQVLVEDEVFLPKNTGSHEFTKAFGRLWTQLKKQLPWGSELVAAGFSPVGTVEAETKTWISCNRWPKITNLDFRQIEDALGVPIYIRRNLEAILSYEISRDEELASGRTVLVHWGYGVGSAFAYNGIVLETESASYTGLGHVVIDPSSPNRCQCGAYGCLEAESGLWALVRTIKQADNRFVEDSVDDSELLSRISPHTVEAFSDAIDAVAQGTRTLCKLFSPHNVLFLSPFAENEYVTGAISKSIRQAYPEKITKIPIFRVIGSTFHGCLYANVHPVFRAQLRRILIST